MNTKAKGTRAEHRAMKQLEAIGYSCTRAAASLGAWDVIAIGNCDPGVRLVQVKCNRRAGSKEMAEMRAFPAPPGVRKEMWVYKDGRPRDPIIEIID